MSGAPLNPHKLELQGAVLSGVLDALAQLYNAIPRGHMTPDQQAAVREARAVLTQHGRLTEDPMLKLTDRYARDPER